MKQIKETPDEFAQNTINQLIKREEPDFVYMPIIENIYYELKHMYDRVDRESKVLVETILELRNQYDGVKPVPKRVPEFIITLLNWRGSYFGFSYWEATYYTLISLNRQIYNLSLIFYSCPEAFADSLIISVFTKQEWAGRDRLEALCIREALLSIYEDYSLYQLRSFLQIIIEITEEGSSYVSANKFLTSLLEYSDNMSPNILMKLSTALEINQTKEYEAN